MSVIDVAFWGVIFASGMGLRLTADNLVADREWAKGVGAELSQLNVALAQRLSNDPELPDGVYGDWSQFHTPQCGGVSPIEALPCQQRFDGTGLSSLFRDITVSTMLNAEGVAVRVGTINLAPARLSPFDDPDRAIAGTIVSSASAANPRNKNSIDYAYRWNATVNPATSEITSTVHLVTGNSIWVSAVGDSTIGGHLEFETGPGGVPTYDLRGYRTLTASRFVDWENNGYFVDGVSAALMDVEANTAAAPRIVDSDDSNFMLDPAWKSNFRRLEVGAIRVNRQAVVGSGCNADDGDFARTATHELLSCQGGIWVRPGDSIPRGAIFAFDLERCPEGFIDVVDINLGFRDRVIVGVNQASTMSGMGAADFGPYYLSETSGRTHFNVEFKHFPRGRMVAEGSTRAVKEIWEPIDTAGENNEDLNMYYRVGRTTGTGDPIDIRTAYQEVLMCYKT